MKGTYNQILDFTKKKKFEGNNARVKSSYLQSPCRESETLEMKVGVFLNIFQRCNKWPTK